MACLPYTIVVAPNNFRYTGTTFYSITFQWNPLTVDGTEVSQYVIMCSRENFSSMVRKLITVNPINTQYSS